MSKRSTSLLLEDMREAAERITGYVTGMSQAQFVADRRTADAVARNLEILGEAANRLPADFTQRHPDVPWPKIVGLRHQHELPSLKGRLERLRADV